MYPCMNVSCSIIFSKFTIITQLFFHIGMGVDTPKSHTATFQAKEMEGQSVTWLHQLTHQAGAKLTDNLNGLEGSLMHCNCDRCVRHGCSPCCKIANTFNNPWCFFWSQFSYDNHALFGWLVGWWCYNIITHFYLMNLKKRLKLLQHISICYHALVWRGFIRCTLKPALN